MCQTHHRQWVTSGRTWPIRPYRRRAPNTVKFAGLRLTPTSARAIARYAEARGLSHSAAIAQLLEQWTGRSGRGR
jgi:hypothetical protein